MTEPLYTYEYKTAGGFVGHFLSRNNDRAKSYILGCNQTLSPTSAAWNFRVIKLTNTETNEVVWEKKDD